MRNRATIHIRIRIRSVLFVSYRIVSDCVAVAVAVAVAYVCRADATTPSRYPKIRSDPVPTMQSKSKSNPIQFQSIHRFVRLPARNANRFVSVCPVQKKARHFRRWRFSLGDRREPRELRFALLPTAPNGTEPAGEGVAIVSRRIQGWLPTKGQPIYVCPDPGLGEKLRGF